jgi:hypothetical protein
MSKLKQCFSFAHAYRSGQVVVKEGTSVTLVCHAEGNPVPSISWHRGDQLIQTGPALTLAQVISAQIS